jgi:hypothetical protein
MEILMLLALALPAVAQQASRPTAQEILDRMGSAYGEAYSYQDSGSLRTTWLLDDGSKRVTERRFKTAFVRRERFRYEYSERDELRYIIWAHGRDVRAWSEFKPSAENVPSIGYGLGAAAGVSGGTSMTVPTLLMPDEVFSALEAGARQVVYADPVLLSDDVLSGVPCFRLQVKRNSEPSTMWIAQDTYLIRRIDSAHKFDTFRTEDTTVYEPVINGQIDEAQLVFGAPESNGGLTKR